MSGSIRRKAEDRWEIRVESAARKDGKRRQVSRSVRGTREDAEAALQLLSAEHGRHVEDPTLGMAAQRWADRTAANRTAGSNTNLKIIIDKHILPNVGHIPLRRLTAQILDKFYFDHQKRLGLSSQTIRRIHFAISPALRFAVRCGWTAMNPAEYVELPPVRKQEIELPTEDQVRLLVEEAARRDPELALFLRLSIVTAARRGEVTALRWADVHLDRGAISVEGSIEVGTGRLTRKPPKTRRSRRTISIDADLVAMLARCQEKLVRFGALNPHDYIFGTDKPTSPAVYSQRFRRLAQSLGIQCRMHDLRHFGASMWIAAGLPVTVVSARLGHSKTSTTLDVYTHLMRPDDGGG